MPNRYRPVDVRFWEKVEPTGFCWLWRGFIGTNGYGQFSVDARLVQAHRWSYEALVGPIPPGLNLDHLCRIAACVNPDHLEPVVQRVNAMRAQQAMGSDPHCRNGHTREGNTYTYPNGDRSCRECKRIRDRKAA